MIIHSKKIYYVHVALPQSKAGWLAGSQGESRQINLSAFLNSFLPFSLVLASDFFQIDWQARSLLGTVSMAGKTRTSSSGYNLVLPSTVNFFFPIETIRLLTHLYRTQTISLLSTILALFVVVLMPICFVFRNQASSSFSLPTHNALRTQTPRLEKNFSLSPSSSYEQLSQVFSPDRWMRKKN